MKPQHQFQTYIRTTPDRLWQALTNGADTLQYMYNSTVESTWEIGAPYRYVSSDGNVLVDGEVLEYDPPRRLRVTFRPLWIESPPSSLMTYEIEPQGAVCKLTVSYDDLSMYSPELVQVMQEGDTLIFAGLKTWLETGEPLVVEDPATV